MLPDVAANFEEVNITGNGNGNVFNNFVFLNQSRVREFFICEKFEID